MAEITEEFYEKANARYIDKEITLCDLVKILNEEARRQPVIKRTEAFSRYECAYQYCPNPLGCEHLCVYPNITDKV